MDISNDLDEYQERLERLAEEEESERDGERAGRLFASASGSSRDEDEYDDDADDAGGYVATPPSTRRARGCRCSRVARRRTFPAVL